MAREDTGERNERVDDVEKRKKGGVGWVVGVSEVLVVTLGREWFPSIFPRSPKSHPILPLLPSIHPLSVRLFLPHIIYYPPRAMSNPSNIPDSTPDAGPSSPAAEPSADHPMTQSVNGTDQVSGGTTLPNGADASQSQSHPRTDAQAARGTSPQPLESSSAFAARRAEETARRDRSLAEFLVMLDGYKPLVGWATTASSSACGFVGGIELMPGLADTRRGHGVLSSKSRL